VGEFGDGVEAEFGQPVADEILDGLDVVAGDRLLGGEPVDLGLSEFAVQGAQPFGVGLGERRRAEQTAVGEGDQPLDFDLDAGAVEPRLGEMVRQTRDRRAVAAVEGTERLRGQGSQGMLRTAGAG